MSPCIHYAGALLNSGGDVIRMDTAKGVVAFEWHDYCGPMPITLARGREGSERRLPPKHPFWAKVSRWCDEGRPVVNGWAVVSDGRLYR